MCMVWAVYMGASLCVRERFHIRIMVAVQALPTRFGKYVIFIADIAWAFFCLFMLRVSWDYLVVFWQFPETSPSLGINQFYPQTILVIGYALMLVRLVQTYFVWWTDGANGLPGMLEEQWETLMGVPLFVSVGLTTALALFLIDIPYTLMAQTGYGSLTPFPLLTIPLFVLAGRLMEVGGMASRMIAIATNLVGAYRGSMGLVTVFACMLFAALSGSGPATTAAIGSVTVPAMKREGYDVPFAAAITASAGALGSLIPPSNLLIIYGLVSETSIPRLFLAGLLPGVLVTILLMITTYIIARRRGYGGDGDAFSWQPFLGAAWDGKWSIGAPRSHPQRPLVWRSFMRSL